ncbi:MAG: hypothetical protein L0922_03705, partial [Candidatus Mariimomonas ferrooxydans]
SFMRVLDLNIFQYKKSDLSSLLEIRPAVAKQNCRVSDRAGAYAPNKKKLLKDMQAEINYCRLCRLSKGRRNVVFGEGNPDAELMFI